MELDKILEFKYTPEINEKLLDYGFTKTFAEGDVILNENAYIKKIIQNGLIISLGYTTKDLKNYSML